MERIIKNSKAVGDKLAMTDTGMATCGTQDTILKDIQSLIDQQNDPPPSPDQNPDQNKKNMDDMNKKDDMMPMGGMGDMNDMKNDTKNDMSKGGMQQPMGGNKEGKEEEAHSRRPRQQNGGQPKENRQSKGSSGGKQQSQAKATNQPPKNPKNTGGTVPDPGKGKPKDPGRPTLPLEEEIVKEVWGHLPDKLRQQATQYYQQDFMPRYSELLKLYYSSLTEKGGKK